MIKPCGNDMTHGERFSMTENMEGYSGELCGSCKTAVELRRYASDQDR